jgi:hypothetical protein
MPVDAPVIKMTFWLDDILPSFEGICYSRPAPYSVARAANGWIEALLRTRH